MSHRRWGALAATVAVLAATCCTSLGAPLAGAAPAAPAAQGAVAAATQAVAFTTSDGVVLRGSLLGAAPLAPRPVVVEFTPYGTTPTMFAGPDFNYVVVHDRGTGLSQGQWNMMGNRADLDVAQFLGWACHQPWSNGSLALNGSSASAISAYNAMRLHLPCLKTAVLWAGTASIYRDLVDIGGELNWAVIPFVGLGIGEGFLSNGAQRLQQDPGSFVNALTGLGIVAKILAHSDEDAFWNERNFAGDVNHVPILEDTGFFDPEERGPFQTFQATRVDGSHLVVQGAHDGPAGGSAAPWANEVDLWLHHYLLGVANGVEDHPAVQTWIADGSREGLLQNAYERVNASTWPIPGTQWPALYLNPTRSGTADSLNDGSLSLTPSAAHATQAYASLPSNPLATDPGDISVVGGALNSAASSVPSLTEMTTAEPQSLTYTSAPLAHAVDMVGPGNMEVYLATTAPATDLNVVVADVWPDGSSHPVGVGRLHTAYPNLVAGKSLVDSAGDVVQPFNDFSHATPTTPGTTRKYSVEIWPIGNRFEAGHRIRIYLTGTPITRLPTVAALNTVGVGGVTPSRILLPIVPADGSSGSSGSVGGGAPLAFRSASSGLPAQASKLTGVTALLGGVLHTLGLE